MLRLLGGFGPKNDQKDFSRKNMKEYVFKGTRNGCCDSMICLFCFKFVISSLFFSGLPDPNFPGSGSGNQGLFFHL